MVKRLRIWLAYNRYESNRPLIFWNIVKYSREYSTAFPSFDSTLYSTTNIGEGQLENMCS